MRFAVVEEIYEAALRDKNIYFITGDLSHAKVEEFKKNIPDQYLNAGMAEQNLIGVAAGLALSGMKVFVYSIVPFITLRCFEQIKVDVCYHNVDVTIIGVGGGFAYSTMGATHYAIEDIAALRALPNMQIVSPANPLEGRLLTREVIAHSGPAYIRIGKGGEPMPEKEYTLEFGKGLIMKQGNDVTIFSTGTIVSEALNAASLLDAQGLSTEVINLHTIKPLDTELIANRVRSRKAIFSLEEHNLLGGLGSAVAEVISEQDQRILFKRFGVPDEWPKTIGTQQYLRSLYGLTGIQLAKLIYQLVSR
ncbi:MAG: transketolase C-terminal domain-containing protein [bacterium]|nr:transketolase C-terminal domain-containing protein [bacterium]